jgi:TRAP-type uncharacterized transport system fused permease subunit
MFFYNGALLMDGVWYEVLRAAITAIVGVFLLSSGVQGWFVGKRAVWFVRVILIAAALFMIEGGLISDAIGIALIVSAVAIQKLWKPALGTSIRVRGAD